MCYTQNPKTTGYVYLPVLLYPLYPYLAKSQSGYNTTGYKTLRRNRQSDAVIIGKRYGKEHVMIDVDKLEHITSEEFGRNMDEITGRITKEDIAIYRRHSRQTVGCSLRQPRV